MSTTKKILDKFSSVKSPQYRLQLRRNAQGLCACGRKLKTKRHCKKCAKRQSGYAKAYKAKMVGKPDGIEANP